MNLFVADVEHDGGRVVLRRGPIIIDVTDRQGIIAQHEKVVVGVRPGDCGIDRVEQEGAFAGRVELVTPVGSSTIVVVDGAPGPTLKVKVGSRVTYQAGDVVFLSVSGSRAYLFDGCTGRALEANAVAESEKEEVI